MKEDEAKAVKAVRAVIDVAGTNFPSDTDVVVMAKGKNTASVTLPSYLLSSILRKE